MWRSTPKSSLTKFLRREALFTMPPEPEWARSIVPHKPKGWVPPDSRTTTTTTPIVFTDPQFKPGAPRGPERWARVHEVVERLEETFPETLTPLQRETMPPDDVKRHGEARDTIIMQLAQAIEEKCSSKEPDKHSFDMKVKEQLSMSREQADAREKLLSRAAAKTRRRAQQQQEQQAAEEEEERPVDEAQIKETHPSIRMLEDAFEQFKYEQRGLFAKHGTPQQMRKLERCKATMEAIGPAAPRRATIPSWIPPPAELRREYPAHASLEDALYRRAVKQEYHMGARVVKAQRDADELEAQLGAVRSLTLGQARTSGGMGDEDTPGVGLSNKQRGELGALVSQLSSVRNPLKQSPLTRPNSMVLLDALDPSLDAKGALVPTVRRVTAARMPPPPPPMRRSQSFTEAATIAAAKVSSTASKASAASASSSSPNARMKKQATRRTSMGLIGICGNLSPTAELAAAASRHGDGAKKRAAAPTLDGLLDDAVLPSPAANAESSLFVPVSSNAEEEKTANMDKEGKERPKLLIRRSSAPAGKVSDVKEHLEGFTGSARDLLASLKEEQKEMQRRKAEQKKADEEAAHGYQWNWHVYIRDERFGRLIRRAKLKAVDGDEDTLKRLIRAAYEELNAEEGGAATRVQAMYRGRTARRLLNPSSISASPTPPFEEALDEANSKAPPPTPPSTPLPEREHGLHLLTPEDYAYIVKLESLPNVKTALKELEQGVGTTAANGRTSPATAPSPPSSPKTRWPARPPSPSLHDQMQNAGAIAIALKERRKKAGYQAYLREKAMASRGQKAADDDPATLRHNPVKMVKLMRSLSEAGTLTRATDRHSVKVASAGAAAASVRRPSGAKFAKNLHKRVALYLHGGRG